LPKGTDCPAIDGLIKEADEVAGEIEDKRVLDARDFPLMAPV
jgi:ferritin-like metal-binding protein YciE